MINNQALSLFSIPTMHDVMEKTQIIPIARLLGGKVVDRDGMNLVSNSIDLINNLKERYDEIYIVDIDGILRNKPQLNLVQKLGDEVKIWLDGGVRYTENVVDYLIAGASKVVVDLQDFYLDELRKTCDLTKNIVLSIDHKNSIVKDEIKHTKITDLVSSIKDMGIDIIIFPKGCKREISSLLDQGIKIFIKDLTKNIKGIDEMGIEEVLVEV